MALCDTLSNLNVPTTIFINEKRLAEDDTGRLMTDYLKRWIDNSIVTPGTHTYSHPHYSEVDIDLFTIDVIKGMTVTKGLCTHKNERLRYFRFPFNDLGKDSLQHLNAIQMLDSLQLIATPFTIESSDWMFNAIYNYYINSDSITQANMIGEAYVCATINKAVWIDSLTLQMNKRPVKQIYLCHDNAINKKYLPRIIQLLKEKNYQFISLDEALTDPFYDQSSYYYKNWGISWVYRFMQDNHERMQLMQSEPDVLHYYEMYEQINSRENY